MITQHFVDDSIDDICNTIGQPLPHTEVSIRSVDSNETVPIDSDGEICVRAYCNMIEHHGNPGAPRESIDSEGWLHDFCREHMSPQKTPTIWCRVDEFPLTGSRKIQKFVIRDRFLEGAYAPLPMG